MMAISFVAIVAFACLLASMDCKIAAAVYHNGVMSNNNNLKYEAPSTSARPMSRSLLLRGGSRVIHSSDAQAFDNTLQQAGDQLVSSHTTFFQSVLAYTFICRCVLTSVQLGAPPAK